MFSSQFYMPCGAPSTKAIYHKRDDTTYRMCEACADHNVRNRAGELVLPEKQYCKICKRELNNPHDPTSKDCGGDCLQCMATVAEDPEAIAAIERINEWKSDQWWLSNTGELP